MKTSSHHTPRARVRVKTIGSTTLPPQLQTGDLYLFHRDDRTCPPSDSLWGIVDNTADGVVHLESSSTDLIRFRLWHPMPAGYNHCRRASRSELRDYMTALAWYEYTDNDRNTLRNLL